MSRHLKRTSSQSWAGGVGANKVLITDKVSKVMVEMLVDGGMDVTQKIPKDKEELKELIKGFDILLVRSGTQVTAEVIEASAGLKLIGRAGTGVDNIDIVAATKKGIMVMNTPGANTISAAEHTVALMMAVARNIQQAAITFKVEHKWARSQLMGMELHGKTVGILGLGRIGREVAIRCQSFGMRTIGYDPIIPAEFVAKFGITALPINDVFAQSDILSVHTPLVESTRNLLGKKTFPLCKKGVVIINCARGGIVDEEALIEAIDSNQVGGAGFDVFLEEPPKNISEHPLVNHPKVTVTPHLGASTEEAQDKVARELATQVLNMASGKSYEGIINAPALTCALNSAAQPWLSAGYKIGSIIGQVVPSSGGVQSLEIETAGSDVKSFTDGFLAATAAGFLSEFMDDSVNMVNALAQAEETGLRLSKKHIERPEIYRNEVAVHFSQGNVRHVFRATVFHDSARIVQIDDFYLEIEPSGLLLFIRNKDIPGMAAFISHVLGEKDINISFLSLGRHKEGDDSVALTLIGLDSEPPKEILDVVAKHPNIKSCNLIHVHEP
eukprot:CAMPEP_0201492736 /NCGR_PEP_ID=MMETSP0151_2-20130828/34531_1 /ASSEMBLY_ACC=CAM_ASM_000257 /TAXON_ID=200890 /ORGANISM="Paramoeba atlantica, Strain 621/1 / CCAP 1560/9" /LENGTH=554 /DNA_ID=CAMNT_0047879729 /DNA_START=22 /DNA_END=1686 /DNA_ORIENTATION=+